MGDCAELPLSRLESQLLLSLIETGQTLPGGSRPMLFFIQYVVVPLAKAAGYRSSYPEYTSEG